jgi:hypothetical protein
MVGVGDEFPQFHMNTCEVNGLLASISDEDRFKMDSNVFLSKRFYIHMSYRDYSF